MKNILRELRTERGWSQAYLADQLEVSRQTINAIETGRYDPSLPLAFALARLFQKPIEVLFVADEPVVREVRQAAHSEVRNPLPVRCSPPLPG